MVYIDKAAVVAKINKLKVYSEEAVQEFGREGYMDNVLFEQSKIHICEALLSFLETLEVKEVQEEPVSEDLGEATNNYCVNVRKGYPRVMDETDRYIYNAFKAGAEWGKNQAMAEIQAQSMALVHGCPEEKTSKDLENAAKHYLYSNILYDDVYVGNPTEKDCIEMFKAGAKWQKEKEYTCYEEAFEDGAKWKKEHIIKRLCNHANIDQMAEKFEDKYKPKNVLDVEYYKRGIYDTIKTIKGD